jgi:hypothetical protein
MSSQGPNTTNVVGYAFSPLSVRDSSDFTSMKKQRIAYADPKNQVTTNTANKTDKLGLSSEKYGSDFRLTFLNGRFKCRTCNGNAFSGDGIRSGQ